MAGFNAISLKLKEMYQMITLGGDAELELVDTLDPFSEVGMRIGHVKCCQLLHARLLCLLQHTFKTPSWA
jgi:hypothetical protein